MYLATFVVTIMEADAETGRSSVSHVEVGSTEINISDVLTALVKAREQATQIVEGLKAAGFKNLTRQDCQIHIRPATIQLMLDPEWKYQLGSRKTISGYMEEGVFLYDPRQQLATLNTSTKPKGISKPNYPKELDPNVGRTELAVEVAVGA